MLPTCALCHGNHIRTNNSCSAVARHVIRLTAYWFSRWRRVHKLWTTRLVWEWRQAEQMLGLVGWAYLPFTSLVFIKRQHPLIRSDQHRSYSVPWYIYNNIIIYCIPMAKTGHVHGIFVRNIFLCHTSIGKREGLLPFSRKHNVWWQLPDKLFILTQTQDMNHSQFYYQLYTYLFVFCSTFI